MTNRIDRLFLLFLLILLLPGPAQGLWAQSNAPLTTEDLQRQRDAQNDPDGMLWNKAIALGDWPTAIVCVHKLLSKDPANTYLQDSLAAMYLRTGQTSTCLQWCQQMLQKRPDAHFILRMAGGIEAKEGRWKAALGHWERLASLSGHPFDIYQVASLQYLAGRYVECRESMALLRKHPALEQEWIHLDWEGGGGDVPMQAALWNLTGNLELALGKKKAAKAAFKEALRIAPEFGLAKLNLKGMRGR